MSNALKRTMILITAVISSTLLSACFQDAFTDTVDRINEVNNYRMTLTLHDMVEEDDWVIIYEVDGSKRYYELSLMNQKEIAYEVDKEEETIRYTPTGEEWHIETVNTDEDSLIQNDSIFIKPDLMEASLFKENEDNDWYDMKEDAYATMFGEKAGAVRNVRIKPEDNALTIEYAFTQNADLIQVSGTIEAFNEVEVTLPY